MLSGMEGGAGSDDYVLRCIQTAYDVAVGELCDILCDVARRHTLMLIKFTSQWYAINPDIELL
jgi:hypothetical protein